MKLFCLSLVLMLFLASGALAATSSRDAAREVVIEAELAQLDPALVGPFRNARAAAEAKNYAESERLLQPICQRFPNFDAARRRLGYAMMMQDRRQEGIAMIEAAVAIRRSSANLATLAYGLGFGPQGSDTDQNRALKLLLEARGLPDGTDADILSMLAQLGFQQGRNEVTRAAVHDLQKYHPDEMFTHYFAACLASTDQKWNLAVREIRAAQRAGFDAESVNRFLDSGVKQQADRWLIGGTIAGAIGFWAIGLVAFFALGYGLSGATLRQVEATDPNQPISAGERRLRQAYRAVLNVTGIYYYVSLPIVLLLVIAAAAGICLGFMMLGWLPIKLLLLVGFGAIATVWAMVRSLFLKVKPSDPGRALNRDEAPQLWSLVEEVARDVQTRAVDEIRITVGTDLCVYERGTWREKLQNRAKRILVIGVAVLDGFKQEDFRSVLAHEYGHFSNRDTAGGDIAFRVQNDMLKFYYAMVNAGQATWLNIGFHFLRAYNFIFRRISHGATRLQEVLADRVAAQHYGSAAFESGLRHVIRQNIAFDSHANLEIKNALEARRPLQNLYASELTLNTTAEEQFKTSMDRLTTDDDTHPAPKDRFRLIAKVQSKPRAPSEGVVWDLFASRSAIAEEMTASVEKNIAPHRA